jgi:hypothetical protein
MWNKTAVSWTRCCPNSHVEQMLFEHVGFMNGCEIMTGSFLPDCHCNTLFKMKVETYLSDFQCHFKMIVVWLASCEKGIAIGQVDIVLRVLHLELFSRKISVKHETTHVFPPYTMASRSAME